MTRTAGPSPSQISASASAIGEFSTANAVGASAFGTSATASAANSVALGAGSLANRENTVSVGTSTSRRQITNVADGTQDNDAVNVGQLNAQISTVTTAIADNATDIGSNSGAIALLQAGVAGDGERFADVESTVAEQQTRIQNMETSLSSTIDAVSLLNSDFEPLELRVDSLQMALGETNDQVKSNVAGIAIANAMAGSTWLQSNETVAVTGNWGYYDGETALAFAMAARADHNLSMNWAVGLSPKEGTVGARAGVRLGW